MAANLENILTEATAALRANKPFVLYAKPRQHLLKAFFQKNADHYRPGNYNEPGFVFYSFDGTAQLFIPEKHSEYKSAGIEGLTPSSLHLEPLLDENEKSAFEALVSRGIDEINSVRIGKVVLSRKEKATTKSTFTAIYKSLLATYPTAFRYCWFHPGSGLWMGATPEQLLETSGLEFKTVALAGTQPFIDTEHVPWQEKEKEEQRFVTDFITDRLRNEASEIHLSEPYTARAGNLLHIKTDISGTLADDSNLKHILDILHPTPAVCGYPKADAMKFILENEGYDREFYSGFLGEIGTAGSDLFVNLRCMKIAGRHAYIYVGCGITKDSDSEKEYIETANKALTMKKILV